MSCGISLGVFGETIACRFCGSLCVVPDDERPRPLATGQSEGVALMLYITARGTG